MISKRFIKSFLPLFFQLPHKTLTKFIFYPFSFFKKAEQKTLLNYFDKELTESDFQIKITEIENQVYLNWNDENFDLCLKLRLESQAIKQSYYKSEQYEGFSEDCCKIGVLYTELLEDEKALIYFDLALQHLLDDPINYPIISDIKHNKGIKYSNKIKQTH